LRGCKVYRIIIEIEKKGENYEDFQESIKVENGHDHELEEIVGDVLVEFLNKAIGKYRKEIKNEAEKMKKGKEKCS